MKNELVKLLITTLTALLGLCIFFALLVFGGWNVCVGIVCLFREINPVGENLLSIGIGVGCLVVGFFLRKLILKMLKTETEREITGQ